MDALWLMTRRNVVGGVAAAAALRDGAVFVLFGDLAREGADDVLIALARAEVVEEAALYETLRARPQLRAVLDVWYQYPQKGQLPVSPSRWPLHALPNVRATPHISGITPQLLERRYGFMARNIAQLQAGEPLDNVIFQAH
mgnify:CR=1 FL=1